MPQFDIAQILPQLPWLAGVFLLLFILARLALPRVDRVVEDRRERIAADLRVAEAARDAARAADSGSNTGLAEARAKAQQIAARARDEAGASVAGRLAEVDSRLAEELEAAATALQETRASVLAELGQVAGDATVALVERVSGEQISLADARLAVGKASA